MKKAFPYALTLLLLVLTVQGASAAPSHTRVRPGPGPGAPMTSWGLWHSKMWWANYDRNSASVRRDRAQTAYVHRMMDWSRELRARGLHPRSWAEQRVLWKKFHPDEPVGRYGPTDSPL